MPPYLFHFVWPDEAIGDTEGGQLEDFSVAYRHACDLVRGGFCEPNEDWFIKISDGTDVRPAVALPARVPRLRLRRNQASNAGLTS
jgi:hypothetical protein